MKMRTQAGLVVATVIIISGVLLAFINDPVVQVASVVADVIGITSFFVLAYQLTKSPESKGGSGIELLVKDALHTKEGEQYTHHLGLEISNNTERLVRFANIKVYDKRKNEMKYITRRQTSPITEFDLEPDSSTSWWVFCVRDQSDQSTHVKIKVSFPEIGKKTHSCTVESTLVPNEKFPTGEFFVLF